MQLMQKAKREVPAVKNGIKRYPWTTYAHPSEIAGVAVGVEFPLTLQL